MRACVVDVFVCEFFLFFFLFILLFLNRKVSTFAGLTLLGIDAIAVALPSFTSITVQGRAGSDVPLHLFKALQY